MHRTDGRPSASSSRTYAAPWCVRHERARPRQGWPRRRASMLPGAVDLTGPAGASWLGAAAPRPGGCTSTYPRINDGRSLRVRRPRCACTGPPQPARLGSACLSGRGAVVTARGTSRRSAGWTVNYNGFLGDYPSLRCSEPRGHHASSSPWIVLMLGHAGARARPRPSWPTTGRSGPPRYGFTLFLCSLHSSFQAGCRWQYSSGFHRRN